MKFSINKSKYYRLRLSNIIVFLLNALSASPTKWSNTLKQFFSQLPTNCLNVFDHFVVLALKGLKRMLNIFLYYNYCTVKYVYVVYLQLTLKSIFSNFLRMICHIDFKWGSITFYKQRKQPAKTSVPEHYPFDT